MLTIKVIPFFATSFRHYEADPKKENEAKAKAFFKDK